MNTLRTGSHGIDRSRVYTLNGDNYYDKAVICHPARLARQTKRFRSGPPALLPIRLDARRGQRHASKRGRSQDPLQGRQLLHGLRLRQEDEALSAQRAMGVRTCWKMALECRPTMCS